MKLFKSSLRFITELNKILDRLISDINEITDYLKETMERVSVLKPSRIHECTKEDAQKLCTAFSMDLNDVDALFSEIQLVGDPIHNSDANNIQEAAKFLPQSHEGISDCAYNASFSCKQRAKLQQIKTYKK